MSAEARAHFTAGVNLLRDPAGARYEEAYREFQAAYASSRSPRILGNLGLCAMKLERDAEAVEAYTRYLAEAPDVDAAEREQIERDLGTLKMGVVRVTLRVEPKDAVVIDVRHPVRGEPVRNLYIPKDGTVSTGLRPGHHVIVARSSAGESSTWEFDAQPGSTLSRSLVATSSGPERASVSTTSSSPILPWIVTGAGAAALAASAVTGALALTSTSDIEAICQKNMCPSNYDLEGARASAKTLVTATDVLLIGGGAVTAVGVGWLLASAGGSEERVNAKPAGKDARPTLACGGNGCLAGFAGRF